MTAHPPGELATEGLRKAFGGVVALDDATVTFRPGQVNALIGPNGSGKTTFFNCITGMIRPDGGRTTYRGRDVTRLAPHAIARAGIGRTFQLCRVFPRMSALDNVLAAVRPGGLVAGLRGARRRAEVDRARSWLTRLGIEHLADVEARDLSWGQQKLLELAGVLMGEPETVLLDEPAGGVNPALLDRIGTLVRELNAEGRTFVIVEHNMDLVMSISDHIVVFDRGRPIAEGPPSLIRTDERVLGPTLAPEIELVDVQAGYGRAAPVLRGFSVAVPAGSVVCLVGPNGAGKSTVLKVASGLLRPRSGRILVGGVDLTGAGPQRMLAHGVALVLQGHSVFAEMTVEENVRLGAYTVRDRSTVAGRVAFVKELFPVVAERWHTLAGLLSGGQQKQVEFARSLMVAPKVVLLDEPSMGLDPRATNTVFEQVARMRDAGTAVLLVEQNARRALQTADLGCVLDLGRVHISGPAAQLLADPQLAELYLGGRPAEPPVIPTH